MRLDTLPRRIGLGPGRADVRLGWHLVLALLALYGLALAAFYPRTATNDDEAKYVGQAQVFLRGATTLEKTDALTGERVGYRPSYYPAGTSVALMPFVWAAGRSGAFALPALALLLGIAFTALWLGEDARSPAFALLVFGFPPCLVLGRVVMSDVPSLAIVSLGLWLFWRGQDRGVPWWLASGLVAGASMCFRESNAVPFAPFFAGALLRRERRWWALLVGGLAGVGIRLLAAWLVFDDPFFAKESYRFEPGSVLERLPLYALGLLVFVPGGLAAGLAYRGRRWPELRLAVVLFIALYLLQAHSSEETGLPKRLILALRYLIPVLPLLAFAAAEVAPRAWARTLAMRTARGQRRLESLAGALLVAWILGLAAAAVSVHALLDRWGAAQTQIRLALEHHTDPEGVLLTNHPATLKFLDTVERPFQLVSLYEIQPEDPERLAERHGDYHLALLDRTDSAWWLGDRERNAAFLARLRLPLTLELDLQATPTDRLRIWRVHAPDSGSRRDAG
jgi:4-amino-4-deoxy-L-arabinose transferase-like glycosyltransferase